MRPWSTATGLLLTLALTGCDVSQGSRPLFEDPGPLDPPAGMSSFTIECHGEKLLARVVTAGGPGPHPTVLLLHGFPGNENNFDLAHALARAGWNAAIVHYRGSWGSSGSFSFGNVLEDVEAMIEYLASAPVARQLRSETGRIYLVGHSMGGFAALYGASRRPDLVAGAASLAGFNFGASSESIAEDTAGRRSITAAFEESLEPLTARSGKELVAEYLDAGTDWDLRGLVPRLVGVPVLLVAASRDQVAPVESHHTPLLDALRKAGHPSIASRVLVDGHGFSSSRIELTQVVWRWLESIRQRPQDHPAFMGP